MRSGLATSTVAKIFALSFFFEYATPSGSGKRDTYFAFVACKTSNILQQFFCTQNQKGVQNTRLSPVKNVRRQARAEESPQILFDLEAIFKCSYHLLSRVTFYPLLVILFQKHHQHLGALCPGSLPLGIQTEGAVPVGLAAHCRKPTAQLLTSPLSVKASSEDAPLTS